MESGNPLKVVLPMLTLVPGGMGGSETYATELVQALGRRDDIELTALITSAASGLFPGAHEIVVDRVSGGANTVDRLRSLVQATFGDSNAREALQHAGVIHYPFTVPVPFRRRSPRVITLMDVQHHDVPEMFTWSERLYRRLAYDRPARRADRVMTLSSFSRQRIAGRLGIPLDRIIVAPLAVDRSWFIPANVRRESFVLYPAAAWPHKNHTTLLAAMNLVRADVPEMRLVLTGAGTEKLGQLPAWVEHRGRITRDELRDLYRRAACVAFPSLYEGFGLPPLEAMAVGCPVTVAASGSLPEVCGDAAVFFDPNVPADVARGIREAMARSEDLAARGFRQVERFSWDSCAEAHVCAYREAALAG